MLPKLEFNGSCCEYQLAGALKTSAKSLQEPESQRYALAARNI